MAAIGNLSEQAGFALKKIGRLLRGSILFFRETHKVFPFKNKVSVSELNHILFHNYEFLPPDDPWFWLKQDSFQKQWGSF